MNTIQLILFGLSIATFPVAIVSIVAARRTRKLEFQIATLRAEKHAVVEQCIGLRSQLEGLKLRARGASEREQIARRRQELEGALERGNVRQEQPLHIGGFAVTHLAGGFKPTEPM